MLIAAGICALGLIPLLFRIRTQTTPTQPAAS
jgi:hypothetical protein